VRKQGELLVASPLKGFGERIPYFFLPELMPFLIFGESGDTEFSLFLKFSKTVGTPSQTLLTFSAVLCLLFIN
jgi:hypothetical protein